MGILVGLAWIAVDAGATSGPEDVGLCGHRAVLFSAQRYGDPELPDLTTPDYDVEQIGAVLRDRYGFHTQLYPNATRQQILDVLQHLETEVRDCDAVIVYFSGHGHYDASTDEGYWLPSDATAMRSSWVANASITDATRALPARHVWVIADACYSGMLTLSRDIGGVRTVLQGDLEDQSVAMGLAEHRSRIVWTSSAANQRARDSYGNSGMSPFAYFLHQLLTQSEAPYLTPDVLFPDLRQQVMANTRPRQQPWASPLSGAQHEGGQIVLVRQDAPPQSPSGAVPGEPAPGQRWTSPSGVLFRWVPSGTFTLGSPPDEPGRHDNEGPQRKVAITGLWVMESEVTAGLWSEVMGQHRSSFDHCSPSCPADKVSWIDAIHFANALSDRDGLGHAYLDVDTTGVTMAKDATGYRLLTEAQWEYAARGGEGSRYLYAGSDDVSEVGWVGEDWDFGSTHPVCSKKRNGFGLCDMSGNVLEWVLDGYIADYNQLAEHDPVLLGETPGRMLRGGSAFDPPSNARVANRFGSSYNVRWSYIGVRLAKPGP